MRNPFADCLLTEAGSLASADYMCLSAFHLSRSSVDSRLVTYDLREQGVVIVVVVERTSPFALLVVVAKSKQIKR